MFILIGLTIFIGGIISVILNRAPIVISGLGMGGIWNIVGLLIGFMIFFCIFKKIFHRHGCGCGCGCGSKGSCSCGNDCACECENEGAMDKKEKIAKVTRKRK